MSPWLTPNIGYELYERCENIVFLINPESSDLKELKWLVEKGKFMGSSFHAKIHLFEEKSAIVTSADATDAPLGRSDHEVGVYIRHQDLVKDILAFVNRI